MDELDKKRIINIERLWRTLQNYKNLNEYEIKKIKDGSVIELLKLRGDVLQNLESLFYAIYVSMRRDMCREFRDKDKKRINNFSQVEYLNFKDEQSQEFIYTTKVWGITGKVLDGIEGVNYHWSQKKQNGLQLKQEMIVSTEVIDKLAIENISHSMKRVMTKMFNH